MQARGVRRHRRRRVASARASAFAPFAGAGACVSQPERRRVGVNICTLRQTLLFTYLVHYHYDSLHPTSTDPPRRAVPKPQRTKRKSQNAS